MYGCEIIPDEKCEITEGHLVHSARCVLGCGAYGIVLLGGGKGPQRAMKFQPYGENSARREVEMCNAFNAIKGTKVFTKTFGWFALDNFPVHWYFAFQGNKKVSDYVREMLKESVDQKLFICTIMEYHPYTLGEVNLDMFHLKAIWYMLIDAFVQLRKQHKRGAHRDIHPGNICLVQQQCVEQKKFNQPLEWEPRLIDFQRAILECSKESPASFKNERTSTFNDGNGTTYLASDDMYRLAHFIPEKAKSQNMLSKEMKEFAKEIKTNVTKRKMYGYGHKSLQTLLEHPFFDDIRANNKIPEQVGNKRLKI